MFQCCNSPHDPVRESSLEIFGYLPEIFGETLGRYINVVKDVFQKSLLDPNAKVLCFSPFSLFSPRQSKVIWMGDGFCR